jgi:uncharacterized protein (TIGR03435 family)
MHFPFIGPIGSKLLLLATGSVFALWPQTSPPDLPPSYEVRISPSTTPGTSSSSGPRYSVHRGFDLKAMLAIAYEIDPSRVDVPDSLNDGKRYDFVLVLPKDKSRKTMNHLIQNGIKKHFHLTAKFEDRLMDVYVLTAPSGANPSIQSSTEDSLAQAHLMLECKTGVEDSKTDCPGASMIGIGAFGMTMEQFSDLLARGLNRPVIDETQLKGKYDLEVRGDSHTTEEFLQALREQLGLVLTPQRRSVKMLVVRPT